jgi:spermidine synthase
MSADESAAPGAPTAVILACVAASGAAVTIVELSAVRVFQPFFGSTTPVWTNVIATSLAALAAGYAIGGRVAGRRPRAGVLFVLLTAAGVLTTLAAVFATRVAQLFLADGVETEGMATLLGKGSLGAGLLLVAPPLVLCGAAGPVAVGLLAARGAGRAAGGVLAVSTLASVVGAYLPSVLLVPAIGSRGALLVAAALVLPPALAGFAWVRSVAGVLAALGAAGGIAASALVADLGPARGTPRLRNGGAARVLAERESPFQYVTVREDRYPTGEVDRVLAINEAVYSFHSLAVEGQVLSDSRHYDDYTVLPLLLDAEPGDDLRLGIVGFACGVNAAQWRHFWDGPFRLRVEGAEIDPEVVALGREHFGLHDVEDEALDVVVTDGRAWLAALPAQPRFDAIIVDAFANEIYMPFHLGTREFLELARLRLETGGLLAMNVNAIGADAPNLAALENTLASVFGACLRSSRYGGHGFLLLARNGAEPPDLARLDAGVVRRRFGEREGLAEWDALLDLAADVAEDVTVITPKPGARVLTDDDAPLEDLTDRFVRASEREFLAGGDGEEGERREALLLLSARQNRLLTWIAGAWALVLAAAAFSTRRA